MPTAQTQRIKPQPITEERVRDIIQRLVHPAAVIGIGGAKQMDPRADNPPSTATPRQNTFLLMTEATELARQLAGRVCVLADRIAGCQAENGCATAGEAAGKPGSLIAGLDEDARFTLQRLSIANEALSRIERELP